MDARVASYAATRNLLQHYFPGEYTVIAPGADVAPERAVAEVPEIVMIATEERAALRFFLRALRALPPEPRWHATVWYPRPTAPPATLTRLLRERITFVEASESDAAELLQTAEIAVFASEGDRATPGTLVRALGAGAVPVASRLPAYEEALGDGECGFMFEPGETATLAAHLQRLVAEPDLRERARRESERLRRSLGWGRVAEELETIYLDLAGRRRTDSGNGTVRARLASRPLIDVDLHMHTDHSYDCATPVEVLLAEARTRGLGAIAVTDHNEISGALEARAKANGVKVIVGEEVKTKEQGEVIGLFIEEKIPRGMTLQETIAEIKRQGGIVYVPHPFDRMHSVPDYEHLVAVIDDVDAIEVFNPRIAISEFNEEAVRFAAKYRIPARGRLGRPRAPGPGLGADPHAGFQRPRRVPRVPARRRHHPQPGQPALRAGAQVHPDQGAARGGPAREPRAARSARHRAQVLMQPQGQARPPSNRSVVPATDDEIREKYLERAIRELNAFARRLGDCAHCPRGQLMPVLGSGHPQADIFMVKYSARPSEVEEGVAFYGRTGNALMKSLKRLNIDPLAVYGTLCVKCPVADPAMADPGCVSRLIEELAIVQPKMVVVMGEDALNVVNDLDVPLSRELTASPGELQRFTPSIEALFVPNIDESMDEDSAKRAFWSAFRVLGQWWEDLPPY